ncbi:MAG: DUF5829 family protein [bacterium]
MKDVFLCHVYTFVDEKTYEEIKKSDFLKNEFCHCEEKTHSAGDGATWTGFYLTGENTYIEFFNHKDRDYLLTVDCGGSNAIAFSIDNPKEFNELVENFKQKFLANNIRSGLIEKNIDNNLINWFYYLFLIKDFSMMPELDSWVMTYHQDYPKKVGRNQPEKEDIITRKYYNKECNAVPYDESKLFKDIEEITLWLNDDNKVKFVNQLNLFGYTCEEVDNCVICRGSDVVINIKSSSDDKSEHLILCMSLNREVNGAQIYNIGNSKLELKDKTAVWKFAKISEN